LGPGFGRNRGQAQLSLATCDANDAQPYFFDGRVRQPRIMGEMLFALSDVSARTFSCRARRCSTRS